MRQPKLDDRIQLDEHWQEKLSKIPISFLFHEPRLVEKTPSLQTFRDNIPEDVDNFYDLFIVDYFKRKPVKNARDLVYENRERLVRAFEYYSETPIIPIEANFSDTLGELLERFIEEFIDRIQERNAVLLEQEAEKHIKRLELFSATYDHRDVTNSSRDALAERYGMTAERIRQILKGDENSISITFCKSLLEGNIEVADFKVNPILQSNYFDLAYSLDKAIRLEDFDIKHGLSNEKTRRFICDLLDYHVYETSVHFEPYVIKGEHIVELNKTNARVIKFFSDHALYLSLDNDLIPFLQNTVEAKEDLIDIILDIIKTSERFETYITEDGETLYGLKWEHMPTIGGRIVRILFEENRAIHYKELYRMYNERMAKFSSEEILEDDMFIKRPHKLIQTNGNTGYWSLGNNASENNPKRSGLKEILDTFIKEQNGKVYLYEVIAFVESQGRVHNERSIRSFLSSLCRAVRDHADLFVHKEYLDQYPEYKFASRVSNRAEDIIPIIVEYMSNNGNQAKMKELTDYCQSQTGNKIRDTSLRMMLDAYPQIFGYEQIGARGKLVVLKMSSEEFAERSDELLSKEMLEHHAEVIREAKEYITQSENQLVALSELLGHLISFLPDGLSRTVIYKLVVEKNGFILHKVGRQKYVKLRGTSY